MVSNEIINKIKKGNLLKLNSILFGKVELMKMYFISQISLKIIVKKKDQNLKIRKKNVNFKVFQPKIHIINPINIKSFKKKLPSTYKLFLLQISTHKSLVTTHEIHYNNKI